MSATYYAGSELEELVASAYHLGSPNFDAAHLDSAAASSTVHTPFRVPPASSVAQVRLRLDDFIWTT